jgi:hypothetical protein
MKTTFAVALAALELVRSVNVRRVTEGIVRSDTPGMPDEHISHYEDEDGRRIDVWTMPV